MQSILELINNILHSSFDSIVPLLIVAMGALVCERSGVTNIALDGIMLVGAFIGFAIISALEKVMPASQAQLIYIIGIIGATIAGGLFSLLHAYASINLKANQIISATALNLFAPALIGFLLLSYLSGGDLIRVDYHYRINSIPLLSKIPLVGPLLFTNISIGLYLAVVVFVVVYIFLYKTKHGFRLRACGENPHAADSLGINIVHYRYFGVVTSGLLAGLGGILFTMHNIGTFQSFNATAGFGFLALAVLIFGGWKPYKVLFAASFFGIMRALAASFTTPLIPKQVFDMLPYIVTLVVLAFYSKTSAAPKAVGVIYDKGQR